MAEHPDLDALDLFIQEKGIPRLQTGYCADGNAVGQQEAFCAQLWSYLAQNKGLGEAGCYCVGVSEALNCGSCFMA